MLLQSFPHILFISTCMRCYLQVIVYSVIYKLSYAVLFTSYRMQCYLQVIVYSVIYNKLYIMLYTSTRCFSGNTHILVVSQNYLCSLNRQYQLDTLSLYLLADCALIAQRQRRRRSGTLVS